jgi:AmmeMemoRadiSam system protein B
VIPNPYDLPQTFMEGIYAADHGPAVSSTCRALGVVVPHHLVASEDVAAGIRELVPRHVTNILLLTPDHFQRCPTALCTADVTYRTSFGETHSSPEIVQQLLSSPLISENAGLFRDEHGAYAIAPFLAHYLTGVTVTPLAVTTDWSWKAHRKDLLDLVSRVVDDKTAVVVSSDFSHYLPLKSAEAEDASTSAAILADDLEAIASLKNPDQSDCPACLWVLAALAKARGSSGPVILKHTNSAILMKDENAPETTSHFAIAWCTGQSH